MNIEEKFYNLTEEERDGLKKTLLDIYKDIANFCEHNNLCFMLGGGSVLGAVRHKGFIPWDDDLDILMPRYDYDKFLSLFQDSLLSQNYYCYAPHSENGPIVRFTKIMKKNTTLIDIFNVKSDARQCISVDIFPIENVKKNMFLGIKGFIINVLGFWAVSRYIYEFRNSFVRNFYSVNLTGAAKYKLRMVLGFLGTFLHYKKWYIIDEWMASIDKKEITDYCNIPTGRKHYFGEILPKNVIFPIKKMLFEGIQVNVPHDTHAYLKNLYDDYMEIPKVSNRERHYFIDFSLNEERKKTEN